MNKSKKSVAAFMRRQISGVRFCLLLLFVFGIISLYLKHYYFGAVQILVAVAVFWLNLKSSGKRQNQFKQIFGSLSLKSDNPIKENMDDFPLALVFLDLKGNIKWHNKRFGDEIGENLVNTNFQEIAPDLKLISLYESKDNINEHVTINGKSYQVSGSIVGGINLSKSAPTNSKEATFSEYTIALYIIDRTAEYTLRQRFIDSRTYHCILWVDNYDDLLKSTPENQHANLVAKIDQCINDWLGFMAAVCRKYEKDKYFIVFEHKNYDQAVKNRFNILDTIREINVGNRIPVTLSMGIGCGDTAVDSHKYASAAIDMALGRGGDQVVVKDSEQFKFFGGTSESFEKRTKVKARVAANALREHIKSADTVFIMGHNRPDMDSFGAAVGLSRVIRDLGKPVHVVFDIKEGTLEEVLPLFENGEHNKYFISEQNALSLCTKNSLVIVVDTHNPAYVDAPKLYKEVPTRIVIDHHRQGSNFIDNPVLIFHEPFASSTSEMVTEIIQYLHNTTSELSELEAQALFMGITLDTKNFTTKAGVRTFEAAAFLRQFGVDTMAVKRVFQSDLVSYIKRAQIVEKTEIFRDVYAISYWNNNEEKRANIICAQAADELLNISGVEASFVACRMNSTIVISGRSLGASNVQVVMEALGGGGHLTVAGAQLQDVTMDVAIERLKKAITDTLQ